LNAWRWILPTIDEKDHILRKKLICLPIFNDSNIFKQTEYMHETGKKFQRAGFQVGIYYCDKSATRPQKKTCKNFASLSFSTVGVRRLYLLPQYAFLSMIYNVVKMVVHRLVHM
jgi:hypothetical protein